MRFLAVELIAAFALAPFLPAQSSQAPQPIARIGHDAIYESDLVPYITGRLQQLKNEEYEIKKEALSALIDQKLLENEAKSKGLTTDALIEQMVDHAVAPPTDGEIEAYYLAQKDRLAGRPLMEVRPQIERALIQARRQQARLNFMEQLRQKAAVSITLAPPRVEVAADPARMRGNPDAPITIIEFADYQCPFCQSVEQTVNGVLEKYKGKVRLSFRDFPLRQIHPQAQGAAEASRCAGEQGKYWEYHDRLFANQSSLSSAGYNDDAKAVGLDMNKFQSCLTSGSQKPAIENDLQAGIAAGVNGTPAFYIDGSMLSGAQPASEFERLIDAALARAKPEQVAK